MDSRNNVCAELIRQCGNLPPAALFKSLRLEPTEIDEQELSRAEWFWWRRPNLLFASVWFIAFYFIVLGCLFYMVPGTIWLVLLWILAGASCASIDCMRLDQWRDEYASSIKRIVMRLSERQ
jgi:hypothetical protein